jgi:hypothetical protein
MGKRFESSLTNKFTSTIPGPGAYNQEKPKKSNL